MKAFIGLLQKERIRYLSVGVIGFVFAVLAVWLGPIILHRYNGNVSVYNSRFIIVIIVTVISVLQSLIFFITSVKRDTKQKDLWLHNHQSIYTLIFVKFLYHGVQMFLTTAAVLLGFFFVGNEVVGSIAQIIFFYGSCLYYVVCAYIVSGIIGLSFFTIDLQMKKFVKRGSILLTIIVFFGIIRLFSLLPEKVLPYWKISNEWLQKIYPEFENGTSVMFYEIYLADELFSMVMLIVIYVVICKWLERVMTR